MVRNPAFSDRAKKERFELFIFLQQRIKKILSFFKNKIIISSFDIEADQSSPGATVCEAEHKMKNK